MSKTMSTPQINASTGLFKGLMDFGSAGQDPAAAAEKVAAVIESLSNSKKSLSDVKAAANAVGPEMAEALKKANVKTKDQLKQLIMSGKLAEFGGVAGQFDAVNNTLIGKAKTFFNLIKGQFADFGQGFLEPAKVAMQKIFNIISRDIRKLMATTSAFGTGTFMDSLVAGVDKVSSFMVNVIEKWLPKTQGFFGRIGGWWDSFTSGWRRMVDAMRPMIDGARVLEKAFSPIWAAIKQGGIDNIQLFREELLENQDDVLEFGQRIGDLISGISDFSQGLKRAFFDILPIINDVIGGLTMMFKQAAGFMTMFSGKGSFLSLLPILGMFLGGKKMSATKGGFMTSASMGLQKTMNVQAQNVIINGSGPGVGGPRAPGGPGTSSGRQPMTISQAAKMSSADRGGLSPRLYMQQQNSLIAQQAPRTNQSYGSQTATPYPGIGMTPASGPLGTMNPFTPGTAYDDAKKKGGRFAKLKMARGRYQDMAVKQRYMRSSSQYGGRLFGNELTGQKGINNSMTAKMGTAMALSTMSQFAPEEMQGAMALGGAVGAFNPLAGLAVAGVGGAMQAKGAGKGALSGAMGGAAIGAFFGPAGIAIGAGIGLLAGGIMGGINKLRQQAKEAKESIKSTVGSVLTGIMTERSVEFEDNLNAVNRGGITKGRRGSLEGIGAEFVSKTKPLGEKAKQIRPGDIRGSRDFLQDIFKNQAQYGIKMTEDELKKALKDPSSSIREFTKQIEERGKAFTMLDDVNTQRLDMLEKMSGKTRPELEALAKDLGVNLYDATMKFDEMVTKLKINMLRSADEMKAANMNALLDSTNVFDAAIKQMEATYAIDAKSRTLKDQFDAGSLTEKGVLQYMQSLPSDLAALYKGDAVKAFYETRRSVGTAEGSQFQTGGALEGMADVFLKNPIFQDYLKQSETALINTGSEQVGALLAKSGYAADKGAITSAISGLEPGKQEAFLTALQNGTLPGMFSDKTDAAGRRQSGGGITAVLAQLGMDPATLEKIPTEQLDAATKMDEASTAFKDAVQQYVDNTAKFFGPDAAKPEWWSKEAMSEIMGGDTSSPRGKGIGDTTSSRLAQTMGRHAAMNGQLTGTRTITSAYRTMGLGSPSSDHVTGRAYDLVGQNLGAYSKLVHANGGFAEFHGNNANRHLHVVPGPGGMGDTTVPSYGKMPQSTPARSGSSVTNNITVNGAPGQSPDAIAAAVIQKIEARERNIRERR
jgi:hypothetical protein